jgi:Arc/MetJ-type ribon-helix-helix transcriptional regulator
MRSLGQKTFSAAMRRLLADRDAVSAAGPRARVETNAGRRRTPSSMAMRDDLESFRRAQGAAYWHHDRRPG